MDENNQSFKWNIIIIVSIIIVILLALLIFFGSRNKKSTNEELKNNVTESDEVNVTNTSLENAIKLEVPAENDISEKNTSNNDITISESKNSNEESKVSKITPVENTIRKNTFSKKQNTTRKSDNLKKEEPKKENAINNSTSKNETKEEEQAPHKHSLTDKKENYVASTCLKEGSYDLVTYCKDCNEVISTKHITLPLSDHIKGNVKAEVKKYPYCEKDGLLIKTTYCLVCNKPISKEEEILPKTGHLFKDENWKVVKEPTETEEGLEERYCLNCLKERQTRVIPKLSHIHNLVKIDEVKATCQKEGTKEYYKCSKCGKLYSDEKGTKEISKPETIAKLSHNFDEGKVLKEATCEKDGLIEYTCKVCGGKKQVPITKKGHSLEHISKKDATCIEDGNIEHYKCNVCGKLFRNQNTTIQLAKDSIIIPKTGKHIALPAVQENLIDSTCEKVGSYDEVTYCKDCHKELSRVKKEIPLKGHEKGRVETLPGLEPSCDVDGYYLKVTYCKNCQKQINIETVVIPKTGHSWGDWKVIKDATIDEEGKEERVCKNNPDHIEYKTIPKLKPKEGKATVKVNLDTSKVKTKRTVTISIYLTNLDNVDFTNLAFDGKLIYDKDLMDIKSAVGQNGFTATINDNEKAEECGRFVIDGSNEDVEDEILIGTIKLSIADTSKDISTTLRIKTNEIIDNEEKSITITPKEIAKSFDIPMNNAVVAKEEQKLPEVKKVESKKEEEKPKEEEKNKNVNTNTTTEETVSKIEPVKDLTK